MMESAIKKKNKVPIDATTWVNLEKMKATRHKLTCCVITSTGM